MRANNWDSRSVSQSVSVCGKRRLIEMQALKPTNYSLSKITKFHEYGLAENTNLGFLSVWASCGNIRSKYGPLQIWVVLFGICTHLHFRSRVTRKGIIKELTWCHHKLIRVWGLSEIKKTKYPCWHCDYTKPKL